MREKNNFYEDSEECSKSEIELFSVPPIQTVLTEGCWDTIQPNANYHNSNKLTFVVHHTSDQYLDLSQTELHLDLSIFKMSDGIGTKLTKAESANISVCNNLLHSLFKQIKISLNDKCVENTNDTYAYRAYLETLLSNSKEKKDTICRSQHWHKDSNDFDCFLEKIKDPGDDTKSIPNPLLNPGFANRIKPFCNDKKSTLHLSGGLHCDLFNMNRYMIGDVNLTLDLTRSEDKFYLIGNVSEIGKYKLSIEKAYLKIRRVTVSPSVILAHELALAKMPAKYPIKRVVVSPVVVPMKTAKMTLTNISGTEGGMPNRVLAAFFASERVSGDYTLNPFKIEHFCITELSLKVGSRAIPYYSPLKFDFANDDYMEGYLSFFKNISGGKPNDISYEEYKNGNTVFAFDLTPDLCSNEHVHVPRYGSLDLSVTLEKAVDQSITVMFYFEYDNMIEIDSQKRITFDYNV